jgi:hypothetical protein
MTCPPASAFRPAAAGDPGRPNLETEPLLRLDPELGRYLSHDRHAVVEPLLRPPVIALPRGPWGNVRSLVEQPAGLGVLLLSGLVARELQLSDTASAELLGPGDIIRRAEDAGSGSLEPPLAWTALSRTRAAVLDRSVTGVFFRYPELMMAVLDRISAQAQRLALTQAISQLTGVDRRLEALFWHLADRWGKVTSQGVVVPLHLSHRAPADRHDRAHPTRRCRPRRAAPAGGLAAHGRAPGPARPPS